MGAIPATQK